MKRDAEKAEKVVLKALREVAWPDPDTLAKLAVAALEASGWKLLPPGWDEPTKRPPIPTTALIPDPEEKPLLRPSEVAALLKWSKNTVYALVKSGELESLTVKGRFWIPTTGLRAFLHLDGEDDA